MVKRHPGEGTCTVGVDVSPEVRAHFWQKTACFSSLVSISYMI
ncbi:hypothetical protein SLEP1_g4352 [Rubroshorea leprosula]|uniref:Uncharacterized protein n=1 Tax=Rubroshorea leprosula TaxID=152421 RepID=A0AAV5HNX0_9ROSI|nr:hypothetical protein SLEP1_g4352 [Rubroshorea leprosula]